MKYAVVDINGNQHKVTEGEEFWADKLAKDQKLDVKVLLTVVDGRVKVGKPEVKGAKIALKIIEPEVKGKKLHILKYKAKSRYRRKYGFRPKYTRLLVEKIS